MDTELHSYNPQKYDNLRNLMKSDWNDFLSFVDKVPADKLDYKILLGFLESGDGDVRNGAQLLLDKVPADKLDYKILLGFLESGDGDVRNGAQLLLDEHFSNEVAALLRVDLAKLLQMFD